MPDITAFTGRLELARRVCTDTTQAALIRAADSLGVPLSWVDDFVKYQQAKGWKINGERIKNPAAIFRGWATARRKRLKAEGKHIVNPDWLNVP